MLPLAGIKVVEIAENLAGPYAGQILALMGVPISFDGERPPVRHGAPGLGADNALHGRSGGA